MFGVIPLESPLWTFQGQEITTQDDLAVYENAHILSDNPDTGEVTWEAGYGIYTSDPSVKHYYYYGAGNEITDMTAYLATVPEWDSDNPIYQPIEYDHTKYPSGIYAYLDSFHGFGGDSTGLAALILQLGIDPHQALAALSAWSAQNPLNDQRWLGSPYAFLLSMGIGDPSLAPIVMPVVVANQAALTAGQQAGARDWAAAHPAMSLHADDYIGIAVGVASIAVPAIIGAFGAVGEAGWVSGEEVVDSTGALTATGENSVIEGTDFTGVDATGILPDAPVDIPTDIPTYIPTDVPTDVPTDAPTDVETGSGSGSGEGGGAGGSVSDTPVDTGTSVPPDDSGVPDDVQPSNPDPQLNPQTQSDLANTNPSDLNKVVDNVQKYGSKFFGVNPADPIGSVIQKVGAAVLSSALASGGGGGHATSSGAIVHASGAPYLGPNGQQLNTGINPLTGLPFTNPNTFWYIGLGFLFLLALTSDRKD